MRHGTKGASPRQLTAEEIASAQPDVEARLLDVERRLSLLMILTRAVSQSEDLCFSPNQDRPGWSFASDLAAEAQADLWAVRDALPNAAALTPAPRRGDA